MAKSNNDDTNARRPKSARDPSRRVCEATRRVFEGSTRGSRPHRSRSENDDERSCLIVQPSMILGVSTKNSSARNEMATTKRHRKMDEEYFLLNFIVSLRGIAKMKDLVRE